MAGRIKGVYGKPWSKMAGEVPMSKEMLNRLGQALVDAVVVEAKKDLAKKGRSAQGDPVNIPRGDSFFDSFGYQVSGRSTVVITSTWPWIDQHLEGRAPYRMEWLTREKGVTRVPLVQRDGTVLVRYAPLRTADAWIHPGFARYTFLERGIKKGREAMAEIVMDEVMDMLASGDPTK
jgi:hypothetical protein